MVYLYIHVHAAALLGGEQNDARVDALLCYCLNTGELHRLPIALGAGSIVKQTLDRRYSGISLTRCVCRALRVVVGTCCCAHGGALCCIVSRVR